MQDIKLNTRETLTQVMDDLAEAIDKAPKEKQEEIKIFLQGYTAALEYMVSQQAAS